MNARQPRFQVSRPRQRLPLASFRVRAGLRGLVAGAVSGGPLHRWQHRPVQDTGAPAGCRLLSSPQPREESGFASTKGLVGRPPYSFVSTVCPICRHVTLLGELSEKEKERREASAAPPTLGACRQYYRAGEKRRAQENVTWRARRVACCMGARRTTLVCTEVDVIAN